MGRILLVMVVVCALGFAPGCDSGSGDGGAETGDPSAIVDETGADETGVDETGVDETGVDETGDVTGDETGAVETGDETGVDETGDETGVDETGDETGIDETGDETGIDETGDEPEPTGLPVLGNGQHTLDAVAVTLIGDASDNLDTPRDLEFNPEHPDQLWVANRAEFMTIFEKTGTPSQTSDIYWGMGGNHFFAQPSSIAFGAKSSFQGHGALASAHETDDFTQGPPPFGTPADFMGPTLWTSNTDWFDAGHASHLDMLHNSPNAMGIAWHGSAHNYWVFDGYHSSLTLYLFGDDHGMGGSDHTDGKILRYAEGEVMRVPDVPSHMMIDRKTKLLYVADTGNNRLAVLDTTKGSTGAALWPNYDGCVMNTVNGAGLSTLVDGDDVGMELPSGLVLEDDVVYVGDNGTGIIHAFDLDGNHLDWLDTELGPGALMGMDFDDSGRLHVADAVGEQVLRYEALSD